MCKHIINVQVRDPFHEVHAFDDSQGALSQVVTQCVLTIVAVSMIDISHFSEEDEYCPLCNNHFVVKAERPTALSLA
ncbi:hypothetical protein B5M09_005225 [Aphanomyces astaci]|uniref:Uncharacterized protein n=1 Tax=Aphanomyces astaci TaxID=112090 RepID=A0A425CY92_APHAT|nr:hypothetical protein B5M09_005225 [Aphanomyces astaci]